MIFLFNFYELYNTNSYIKAKYGKLLKDQLIKKVNLSLPKEKHMAFNKNKLIELKDFLELKTQTYCQPTFIKTDPVSIPHRYSTKKS